MERWELAARKFIEQCPFASDIVTVYLTGSYSRGSADKFSDVDLYIVLNDSVDWRERGNKIIDGFMIEYFANPLRQIQKYIEIQHRDGNLITANMVLNSTVLLDKNATSEALRNHCKQKMSEPFPMLSEEAKGVELYAIWDRFNELERAYEKRSCDFDVQYSRFGVEAIYSYSRYIRSPLPPYYHLLRWLTDSVYFTGFALAEYRDQTFKTIMIKFFTANGIDERFDCATKMRTHIMSHMSGFDITNYVLRTPCER